MENDNGELLAEKLKEHSVDKTTIQALFFQSVLGGKNKCLKVLLGNGVNVNAILPMGENVLTWAICNGNLTICNLLIENNINVNQKTALAKETPLMAAARKEDHAIIKALFCAGAQLSDVNKRGQTAQDIATEMNKVDTASLLENLASEPSFRP
ncbi:ankyrin repeat domain-containing protein [Legionella antarctica]|nr:ankyrin repeat domain-containing protein [Legionella antarctica]